MAATYPPSVDLFELDTFLERIAVERSEITLDLAGLALLQHRALAAIPLHDLHVRDGSHPGTDASDMARHAQAGRGNWRFGANATLALALNAVGFDVAISGAALLLDGPNRRIDHVVLEVSAPDLDPHLVDVGIEQAPTEPVRLNSGDMQVLGHGRYQLVASPQGTTLAQVDGDALVRFRRVSRPFDDFAPTVSSERERHRRRDDIEPTITRLIGPDTFDRVTLTPTRIEWRRHDGVSVRGHDDWRSEMAEWFPTLGDER